MPEDDGADAELLHVIVAADAMHQRQKGVDRKENRKTIAENRQRRRDLKNRREQEHDNGHDQTGERAGEKSCADVFRSRHQVCLTSGCLLLQRDMEKRGQNARTGHESPA